MLPKDHSTTWYLHMHKVAGTSLCKLAKDSGEQFWSKSDHRAHIDLMRHVSPQDAKPTNAPNTDLVQGDSNSTLLFIQRLQQDEQVTFVSTEHWFPPLQTVTFLKTRLKMKFITVLRNPVERLISSYFYHKGGGNRIATGATPVQVDGEWFSSDILTYAATCSNMYVRLLNGHVFGPKYFPLNFRSTQDYLLKLSADNVKQAIEMLKQFDAVEIIETQENFEEIRAVMHWHSNSTSPWENKTNNSRLERHQLLQNQIGQDDWYEQLTEINKWDMDVYHWAVGRRTQKQKHKQKNQDHSGSSSGISGSGSGSGNGTTSSSTESITPNESEDDLKEHSSTHASSAVASPLFTSFPTPTKQITRDVESLKEAVQCLTSNTVHALVITRWSDIGDSGCSILSKHVGHSSNLSSLTMRHNLINSVGIQHLTARRSLRHLTTLDLRNNNIGDVGLTALSVVLGKGEREGVHLTSLDVQDNNISCQGIQALSLHQSLVHMKHLNLRKNKINELGGIALSQCQMPNMINLSLWNCCCGDNGMLALCTNFIATSKTLVELNARNCRMTDVSAIVLAQSIPTTLKVLHLVNNDFITTTSAIAFATALTNPTCNLIHLNLRKNYVTENVIASQAMYDALARRGSSTKIRLLKGK
jgi:hypothetical protein